MKFTAKLRKVWEKLGLKTWADWRNVIHVATPVLVTLLAGYIGADLAEAFGVFLAAAVSPALAFWNSTSTLRAWIYGLVVPLQGVLVTLGVVTQAQYASTVAVVLSLISAILATANNTEAKAPEPVGTETVGEKIEAATGRHAA